MYDCNSVPGNSRAAKEKCVVILNWPAWLLYPRHPKDGLGNKVHNPSSPAVWAGCKLLFVNQKKMPTGHVQQGAVMHEGSKVRLVSVGL